MSTQRQILTGYSKDWIVRTFMRVRGEWSEFPDLKRDAFSDTTTKNEPECPILRDEDSIVDEIIDLADNNIIGINLICKLATYEFVLSDADITDSKGTKSVFDYDSFTMFLKDPTSEMWNKLCDHKLDFVGKINKMELLLPE